MREPEFKVLTHCGEFVDVNLLEKGIYLTSKPYLYDKNETIEKMIESANIIKEMRYISDEYFENLKQCKLVSVIIAEKE